MAAKKAPGEAACRQVWGHYVQSAKRKALLFRISYEQFKVLTKMACHYCERPPSKTTHFMTHQFINGEYTYTGLDRMDNSRGYEIDNVVPCCWRCNDLKGARLSYKEMMILAPSIKQIRLLGCL